MIFSKLSRLIQQAGKIGALEAEMNRLQVRCKNLESQLAQCDHLPLPPPELRVRVGGFEDPDLFLGVGRKIFWDLKRLLKGMDKSFDSFSSVLDFGCGCGRVTRFLQPANGQVIVGTDIDNTSIQWCKQHLWHIADFQVNGTLPPLPFQDNEFHCVYGISVFTHLPEDMQLQWLEELKRIIKKNGLLITSLHGMEPQTKNKELLDKFKREGFVYIKGKGTDGLPDFYQTAWHTKAYVQKTWSRYFKILSIQERAINNHQDVVVCQKK
jgi:ubiquinone/menaquinone biosynthesis C-methylase UbiE